MKYESIGCKIDLDPIMDYLEDWLDEKAELAMDAEITKQFETIQQEIEGVCKQYLKELFDKYYLESGERHV